jgi:hypothetical protein
VRTGKEANPQRGQQAALEQQQPRDVAPQALTPIFDHRQFVPARGVIRFPVIKESDAKI